MPAYASVSLGVRVHPAHSTCAHVLAAGDGTKHKHDRAVTGQPQHELHGVDQLPLAAGACARGQGCRPGAQGQHTGTQRMAQSTASGSLPTRMHTERSTVTSPRPLIGTRLWCTAWLWQLFQNFAGVGHPQQLGEAMFTWRHGRGRPHPTACLATRAAACHLHATTTSLPLATDCHYHAPITRAPTGRCTVMGLRMTLRRVSVPSTARMLILCSSCTARPHTRTRARTHSTHGTRQDIGCRIRIQHRGSALAPPGL